MDYLRKLWAKVRAVLVAMPPSQRASIVALLAVVAVSLAMLVSWGGREQYVPVLTGLSGAEMTTVQNALKDSQINYKFGDGMLLVSTADRDKVLMVLSEKGGLPTDISKSFGFEELVKPKGFSMETAEEQQMKYNIALGNMLARMVSASPDLAKAQVLVASARDGYFGPEKATAAVYIEPRSAAPLPSRKLDAICRLVAAGVGPKLAPQDVVVTNLVTGEAYSIADQNSAYAKASDRMELQQNWNKYYARQVEDFLRPALGDVRCLVHTTLDTTSKSEHSTEFDVVEETKNTSTSTGAGAPGGETLTQPNVSASVLTAPTAGQASGTSTEDVTKKRAPVKEVATETPPGEVKDITISVLADLERVESLVRAEKGLKEADLVSPDDLQKQYDFWQTKLMTGLPIDKTSKITRVEFSAAYFGKPADLAAAGVVPVPAASRLFDVLFANWHRVALAVLALVALVMIRSIAKKAQQEAVVQTPDEKAEEDIPLPELEMDMEQKRAAKIRESIEDLVRSDPQTAVGLIRRWMAKES